MKTFLYPLVFLLLFVASSCKKEAKLTTINGQAQTFGTTEPIRHTPVTMQLVTHQTSGSIMSSGSYTVIDETTTDQNGNFSLSGKLHPDESHYLRVVSNTVSRAQGYIPPSNIPRDRDRISSVGGNITQNFHISATGWVRFHFKGENQGTDNYFWYYSGSALERLFGSVDEYRINSFSGNFDHQIACGIFRDGIRTDWQEKFFVVAFDTIDYQIKF
jgi:hypothetical protein